MLSSEIEHPKFKLGQSAILLFLFQILFSVVVSFVLYLFTTVFKLIPLSDVSYVPGIVGVISGSRYFGQWLEKKYPGMLYENQKIKKLALGCSMINLILGLLILVALLYSQYGKSISIVGLGFAIVCASFFIVLMYFITKFFIICGIKDRLRIEAKRSNSVRKEKALSSVSNAITGDNFVQNDLTNYCEDLSISETLKKNNMCRNKRINVKRLIFFTAVYLLVSLCMLVAMGYYPDLTKSGLGAIYLLLPIVISLILMKFYLLGLEEKKLNSIIYFIIMCSTWIFLVTVL